MRLKHGYVSGLPNTERRFDYGVRTDGAPVYKGSNDIGASENDLDWLIHFIQYDEGGNPTIVKSKYGAWSGRVALFS